MTIKEPREMTDRELVDARDFFIGLGPVMSGPFPERRAVAIARELGLRAGVDGGRLYAEMSRAWGSALR